MKLATQIKSGWYIWLFPVLALAISGYYLYDYFHSQGPRIRIAFDDVSSVEPEKTQVKYRGVTVGVVKDILISEDKKDAMVEVLLRHDASDFARAGSKFSLIRPKVTFQGISGLETLIEGTYIAALPGPENSAETHDFKAAQPVASDPPEEGSMFYVLSPSVESLNIGDSVTYRGMRIGRLSKMNFEKGARQVLMQIHIENHFAYLVRANTKFWRKVGVQAKLGLFGSDIKVNSMDSIMNGALELGTPEPPGPPAKNGQKFGMLPAAPKDLAKWNPELN